MGRLYRYSTVCITNIYESYHYWSTKYLHEMQILSLACWVLCMYMLGKAAERLREEQQVGGKWRWGLVIIHQLYDTAPSSLL